MNTEELRIIQNQINIPLGPMTKALELFAEGATIPFIARYRKEVTQGLDEVQLADLQKAWRGMEELIIFALQAKKENTWNESQRSRT